MRVPHRQPESESHTSDPEVMSASDVRQNFGSVVNRVARGEGRVLIEKHGSPAVGIVSIEDIRRLRQIDEELRERRAMVEEIRSHFRDVDPEEMERETEKIFAEILEENRRKASIARDGRT